MSHRSLVKYERLRVLAHSRRRFPLSPIVLLLRREGEMAGRNRIYRLYREEDFCIRRRKARRRGVGTRAPILIEAHRYARWDFDFVHDQFANGRRFPGSEHRR